MPILVARSASADTWHYETSLIQKPGDHLTDTVVLRKKPNVLETTDALTATNHLCCVRTASTPFSN